LLQAIGFVQQFSGTLPNSAIEVRFFHSRENQWSENFQVDVETGKIIGTTQGEVTVEYLEMNSPCSGSGTAIMDSFGVFAVIVR
jgi:hypothetical protein